MNWPDKKRQLEIDEMPSNWSDIDFTSLKADGEKAYWFKVRRVDAWLLKDIKSVKNRGKSMFGLAALFCIGVDSMARFAYGRSGTRDDFLSFLEDYVSIKFKKSVSVTFSPPKNIDRYNKWFYYSSNGVKRNSYKLSEIFYFGLRNKLMHFFMFKHVILVDPLSYFLRWDKKNKRLKVEARHLLIGFENAVKKYFRELRSSKSGDKVYENFLRMFDESFIH